MLREAHRGIFFRPPAHIPKEIRQFPVTQSYEELALELDRILSGV
jgi:phosphoserine/homoserine phosphotransferase